LVLRRGDADSSAPSCDVLDTKADVTALIATVGYRPQVSVNRRGRGAIRRVVPGLPQQLAMTTT